MTSIEGTQPDGTQPEELQPEGQTARDISYADEGLPEVADDASPEDAAAEDPQFAPLPGERANASVDFGTTATEQAEGESLDGRLAREEPDVAEVRPAESPERTTPQLEQDGASDQADSFTDSVSDDVTATGEPAAGGSSPEERAVHLTD